MYPFKCVCPSPLGIIQLEPEFSSVVTIVLFVATIILVGCSVCTVSTIAGIPCASAPSALISSRHYYFYQLILFLFNSLYNRVMLC